MQDIFKTEIQKNICGTDIQSFNTGSYGGIYASII